MQSAGIDLPRSSPLRAVILASKRRSWTRPTRRVEIARARALISYVATQNLSISGNVVARQYNVDRSAISRTTQRVSRDPELPAATKTIQRELEKKSTLKRCPLHQPNILLPIEPVAGSGFVTAGKIDRGTGGCPLSILYSSICPLLVVAAFCAVILAIGTGLLDH